MATFRGLDGSLQYNSQAVAEIKAWTVEATLDIGDASKMGDNWKTNVALQGSWRGQAQVNFDYGDTNGQKAIIDKLIAATPAATGLTAQFRASATKYISGTVLVTGIQINATLGDVIQCTMTFTGTGNPAITWS